MTDNGLTLIRDYRSNGPAIDVEAIIQKGRRGRQRRRLTAGVLGLAATAAIGIGVVTVASSGRANVARVIQPAGRPLAAHGLLLSYPATGHIETVHVTDSGWRAIVYRDTSGGLCEGWVDPTTSIVSEDNGQCNESRAHHTPSLNGGLGILAPILVEPEAGVTGDTVGAFGIVGPDAHSVSLSSPEGAIGVVLSTVEATNGVRAWFATFPTNGPAGQLDEVSAHDAQDNPVGSISFGPPTVGRSS